MDRREVERVVREVSRRLASQGERGGREFIAEPLAVYATIQKEHPR